MYCVNGKYYADLYRNKLSGYADWVDNNLCYGFYFNADNIGPYMSLDFPDQQGRSRRQGHVGGGHSRHQE